MGVLYYRSKKQISFLIVCLVLLVFIVWTIVPVYIVISNSFRRTIEIKQMPPELFFTPTPDHYNRLLSFDRFGVYFRNSVIISLSVTCLTILLGSLAAYGLKISRSRIGRRISHVLLVGKMVPSITILIPLFIMMNRGMRMVMEGTILPTRRTWDILLPILDRLILSP
jgi:multiple sugar transport system permease protein